MPHCAAGSFACAMINSCQLLLPETRLLGHIPVNFSSSVAEMQERGTFKLLILDWSRLRLTSVWGCRVPD